MLTKLEIINAMLAATGTRALSAKDTTHPHYVKAANKLDIVNTEVQSAGLWFNRGIRTLRPGPDGEVYLPEGTLHADPLNTTHNYVIRGRRLYNATTGTYNIGHEVPVNYIEQWPVEDLPHTAQAYVRARAVYDFYVDEDGEGVKMQAYRAARDEALVAMRADDLRNTDTNYFKSASYAAVAYPGGRRRLPL